MYTLHNHYVCNLCFAQDIYAIPSRGAAATNSNQRFIYFLSIVDVLTHYGVKKAAAKVVSLEASRQLYVKSQAAKTVKYGSSVDGISTAEPEQYAKRLPSLCFLISSSSLCRFLAFISDAIE